MKNAFVYLVISLLSIYAFEAKAYCEFENYDRKFIEKNKDGYYLVQEFYKDGKKYTDPFLLKDYKEAMKTSHDILGCGYPDPIIIEGKYTAYYPNGQKWSEGVYKNGYRQGVWTQWYETGEKWSTSTFSQENKYEGHIIYWHKNGMTKSVSEYIYYPGTEVIATFGYVYAWDNKGNLTGEGTLTKEKGEYGVIYGWCKGEVSFIREFKGDVPISIIYKVPREEIIDKGCSPSSIHN